MKRFFRYGIVCLVTAVYLMVSCFSVSAATDYPHDLPYDSYIYNSDNEAVSISSPYTLETTISGNDLGIGNFVDLGDIYYDGSNYIYICDAGNNRIVILDASYKLVNIIKEFSTPDGISTFSDPSGICVNNGYIYIADTNNSRIVCLQQNTFQLKKIFNRPEISILDANYTYSPTRLAVDNSGKMYIIASGINQGLLVLNENGEFSSFLGAPDVETNITDLIWKKFATEAQLAQMQTYVPTEYNSVSLDSHSFVYVTSQTSTLIPVGKINSNGENVLTKLQNDASYGDSKYVNIRKSTSAPYFTDVVVDDNGTYTVLDSQRSKLYTYSKDGYLLYAFGAAGSQQGTLYAGSALEQIGDNLLVTDHSKGTVTVYKMTTFGKNIQTALTLYNNGNYEAASTAWNTVLSECSNYTLAIIGLAKIDIQNGQYKKAMDSLKTIHERDLCASAFSKLRDQIVSKNFSLFLTAFIIIIALWIVCSALWRKKHPKSHLKKNSSDTFFEELKYSLYVIFHPFDGFWDLKREKRGSLRGALTIVAAFIVCYGVRAQFSGYIITGTISSEVNPIYECAMIFIPLIFYVVANWCFTTLMDGEGSMRDIITATGYALTPYVLFSIPLLIMSHTLTAEEAAFYTVLNQISVIWTIALIFFGMMITHDYSLSKAILATVLTLVGICLIIFILLLLVNVIQEVMIFGLNIYQELIFRTF